MPKSTLDWLGVVSLWVGALIMAIKAGDMPLFSAAPLWLASHVWSYVPAVLVTFYVGIAFYRLVRPIAVEATVAAPRDQEPVTKTDHSPEKQEKLQRQAHLRALQSVFQTINSTRADTQGRGLHALGPRARSALLTAHKEFGLPIPAEAANSLDEVLATKFYLREVLPFLELGHDEAAKDKAAKIIAEIER